MIDRIFATIFTLNASKKIVIGVVLSFFVAGSAIAEVRLASWNVMRMNEDNKNFEQMVEIARYFDFIALQEVMSEEGASKFTEEVIRKTGEDWGVMVSHAIGRGTYKEMYAFVWRESKINYIDGAVVYIDSRDAFEREPLSARFEAIDENFNFVAANVHIIYGQNKSRREPELKELRSYWHWLHDEWTDDPVFLFGDFNMTPDEEAWFPLLEIAYPVVNEGATTLSTNEGQYANLYDNIWIPRGLESDHMVSGILRFPEILEVSHEDARSNISDHAPVFIEIGNLTSMHESTLPDYDPDVVYVEETPEEDLPPIVGNTSSRIFHWPGCPGYEATSSVNRTGFQTPEEAQDAGYRAAMNC